MAGSPARALAIALSATACVTEAAARRQADAPPSPREKEAYDLVAENDCSGFGLGLLPGARQLCLGKSAEGATLLALGLAELGTGTAVAIDKDVTHPGAAIPLIAGGDLLLYAAADYSFEEQRARRMLYVPEDSMAELVAAPFNFEVLSALDVFLGIAGGVALGLGAGYLAGDRTFRDTRLGTDPNLFGATVDKAAGYPIATAVGAATFLHVAAAEESFFRGILQSGIARNRGETEGWIWASLIFGAAHAPNAFFVSSDKRAAYLGAGVPFITLLGGYLGATYRWHGYSLAAPVAIHFWYDLLISAIPFFLHPDSSPLSARIRVPF